MHMTWGISWESMMDPHLYLFQHQNCLLMQPFTSESFQPHCVMNVISANSIFLHPSYRGFSYNTQAWALAKNFEPGHGGKNMVVKKGGSSPFSYVGVNWSVFLVHHLLLIGFNMSSKLFCISKSTMKHQWLPDRNPDLLWFSRDYQKCMFVGSLIEYMGRVDY